MIEFIQPYIGPFFWNEFVASILTILSVAALGHKSKWGPRFGVIASLAWIVFMVRAPAWGMLPMNLFCLLLHVRNVWLWEIKPSRPKIVRNNPY